MDFLFYFLLFFNRPPIDIRNSVILNIELKLAHMHALNNDFTMHLSNFQNHL